MKTFLFISNEGKSLPLAQRIYDEGNRVIFCITDKEFSAIGSGLIEKKNIDELDGIDPDIVVFDEPGNNQEDAKELKKQGVLVYGTSAFGDSVATKKSYANKFMKAHGIKVPQSALALKPAECVEVVVEMWFSNQSPILVLYSFDEQIGDDVCGSICKLGRFQDSLFSESVGRFLSTLKKSNFSGQLSMRVVVTKDNLYGYELIPYFNYATLYALLECYKGNLSNMILSLANGNAVKPNVKHYWFMSAKIGSVASKKGTQIKGLNEHNLKHIWLSDVCFIGNSRAYAIGNQDLGYVTARGDSAREARRRVYRTINNLGSQIVCRKDISKRVEDDHNSLVKWGWIK